MSTLKDEMEELRQLLLAHSLPPKVQKELIELITDFAKKIDKLHIEHFSEKEEKAATFYQIELFRATIMQIAFMFSCVSCLNIPVTLHDALIHSLTFCFQDSLAQGHDAVCSDTASTPH